MRTSGTAAATKRADIYCPAACEGAGDPEDAGVSRNVRPDRTSEFTGPTGARSSESQPRERGGGTTICGTQLHGSPALTFNGETVIAAQAVVWPSETQT